MWIKIDRKVKYVFLLCYLLFSIQIISQENAEFLILDREEVNHKSYVSLFDDIAKDEYKKMASKHSDSVRIYLEGFRKGTETSIKVDNKEYIIKSTKHYLIHLIYNEYITLDKSNISENSLLLITIKYDIKNFPSESRNFKFTLKAKDIKLLNSSSVLVTQNDNCIVLEYSKVDEVEVMRLRKSSSNRLRQSLGY